MNIKILLVSASALLVAACTTGPDYKRPEIIVPPAYKKSGDWKIAEPRDAVPRGKWWMIFNDAQLNALAEKVEVSNQNLRLAEAQYRRAQAFTQQARAGFYPTVTGGASVTRSGAADRSPSTDYNLSGRASWKLIYGAEWPGPLNRAKRRPSLAPPISNRYGCRCNRSWC